MLNELQFVSLLQLQLCCNMHCLQSLPHLLNFETDVLGYHYCDHESTAKFRNNFFLVIRHILISTITVQLFHLSRNLSFSNQSVH